MALVRWQATVQSENGNTVINPSITVRNASDNSLATIYDDADASKLNPFTGGVDGFVSFKAEPGRYIIQGASGISTAPDWVVDLTSVDEFNAVSGSAANPSYSFASDPDTGVYSVGSNSIGFSVGGSLIAALNSGGLDIDGTITGDAVTQSNIDVTAGRLLKVNDFGLGEIISYSGNINTIANIPTGFYRVTVSATGTFPGGLAYFNMQMLRSGTSPFSGSIQIAYRVAVQPEVYARFYDGASWSGWQKSYDQGNLLGTVSQSGGTPTGAVIQRGSNGNGEFVRFADGTQICTHSISGGATNTAAGSIYTSGDDTWTFPQSFTSATGLTVAASVMTGGRWCNVYGTTSSDATIRQFNSSSNAGTPNIRVVAIGRWF